ncbi:hypothetical protein HF324_28625 [Chitinophaga oryzae]|uniref:Uncharacterized protein n=1 Tax=Chitinophaga oryzae TaxID=2725414 RepID=A0ABX6LN68_9BACT|nr:hypothetical protein [Chitinophaga oryzae]QJB41595.1 hypothetical protein HF324_28625 [Chitinophaga oryzae]
MSESNLHQHFRDDGNVPIPIPPADDSWKLMERRLNEVMPVAHLAGGQAAPGPTGIINKILPAVKYAAAALVVSGVVLYGIHKINHRGPASTPEKEASPVSENDSTSKTTDSLKDRTNAAVWPDTAWMVNNTTPAVNAADSAGTSPATASGNLIGDTPAVTGSSSTIVAASTGANTPAGRPAMNTPAGAGTIKSSQPPAAGAIALKLPSAGKAAAPKTIIPAGGKVSHDAGAAKAAADSAALVAGSMIKADTHQENTLPSADQQRSGENNTGLPAASPGDHPVAVIGLADVNLPDATAMLKPGLPVRLTLQPLFRPVNRTVNSSLKVSRETMDQLTKRRIPLPRPHFPGYWQLMAQWRIPVPLGNNPALYNGPDGNAQVYRLLVPGVRVQRTWNNAALSLDLNLMTTQLYRNDPYYDKVSPVGANDMITRTLLQTYGYSVSLAYHHRIAGNFFGGAGIQGYYGHTASILETVKYRDTTGTHTKKTTYGEKSKIWNNIGHFQGQLTGEIHYDHAGWQAALRTVIPVLHTARDSTGMNMKPVPQVELMLRWKINRRK